MDLCTEDKLSIHLELVTQLLGVQKGHISGKDLFFVPAYYVNLSLITNSNFYKEAIKAMAALNVKKVITDPTLEHICYNRAITVRSTIKNKLVIEGNITHLKCTTFGEILKEIDKRQAGQKYSKKHTNFYDKLDITGLDNKDDYILFTQNKSFTFRNATQKILYETLLVLKNTYKAHHHVQKWNDKMCSQLDWNKIWSIIHNKISFESTKSAVWEQIHLNFPTQYSFNKWFSTTLNCSLCGQPPADIFHVILDCNFTNTLWQEISPFLQKIDPAPVTDMEKAFGVMSLTPNATLRNWLTHIMRGLVESQDKKAYYQHNAARNMKEFKHIYNQKVHKLLNQSLISYRHIGSEETFDKHFRIRDILVTETEDGDFTVNPPFPI